MPELYEVDVGSNNAPNEFARDQLQLLASTRSQIGKCQQHLEKMDACKDSATGTLSVRSDGVSGQVTAQNHGLAPGVLFDLIWSGGARRGLVPTSVTGDNVVFAAGTATGDNLPAQDAAVTVVHWTTLADRVPYVDGSGQPSPNVAYKGYNEFASMVGVAVPPIVQATGRIVKHNE